MNSNFSFLQKPYPNLFAISELSEKLIYVDPSSSLSKSRLFSEKLSQFVWDFENLGEFMGSQNDRIYKLSNTNCIPDIIRGIMHTIRKSGNKASHDGTGSFQEAHFILKNAFNWPSGFMKPMSKISLRFHPMFCQKMKPRYQTSYGSS